MFITNIRKRTDTHTQKTRFIFVNSHSIVNCVSQCLTFFHSVVFDIKFNVKYLFCLRPQRLISDQFSCSFWLTALLISGERSGQKGHISLSPCPDPCNPLLPDSLLPSNRISLYPWTRQPELSEACCALNNANDAKTSYCASLGIDYTHCPCDVSKLFHTRGFVWVLKRDRFINILLKCPCLKVTWHHL